MIWRRTGTTYEASTLRVLPYAGLPLLGVLGLLLLPFPVLRLAGGVFCLVGFGGLGVLAGLLTLEGGHEEAKYPGYRYRVVEIWRRWATLLGAVEGATAPGNRSAVPPPGTRR